MRAGHIQEIAGFANGKRIGAKQRDGLVRDQVVQIGFVIEKVLPVAELKLEGVARNTHTGMTTADGFVQLLIPEFCDRSVFEMRPLQVEIARPIRLDPAFGKRRTRTVFCYVADAIRHHPDAHLAPVRSGREERDDEIDQVLVRLVERKDMRAMFNTSQDSRKRLILAGAMHHSLTATSLAQSGIFGKRANDGRAAPLRYVPDTAGSRRINTRPLCAIGGRSEICSVGPTKKSE